MNICVKIQQYSTIKEKSIQVYKNTRRWEYKEEYRRQKQCYHCFNKQRSHVANKYKNIHIHKAAGIQGNKYTSIQQYREE